MDDTKWLKEILDKLDLKVDKLDDKLDRIEERHNKNTDILKEHIYRTELNEENISMLREEVKPLVSRMDMVIGGIKLIGFIAVLVGTFEAGVKIFQFFSSL